MKWFQKKKEAPIRQPHISDQNESYAFRRSRTLTGTTSERIMTSANSRHADFTSDRMKHHDLRHKRGRLLLWFVGVAAVAGGLYLLLAQFMMSLQVTSSASSDIVNGYTTTINTYFSTRPNERFLFALNQQALLEYVRQQHPEVLAVSVTHRQGLFRSGDVEVTPRTAIASWTIGGERFYIDENGARFATLVGSEPALAVDDKTGIDPSSAGAVASSRMIHYIGRLVALIQQQGYNVERLELPALTSREVDVFLEGKGYRFKTTVDRDPAGQAADIRAIVAYLDAQQLQPQYVDVRVSSQAYYR